MGMYTQIRGWLNIDSIGIDNFEKLLNKFEKVKLEYLQKDRTSRQGIAVQDTHIQSGFNGSAFIFIGTEFKNYDKDAEKWLSFLIDKFPQAEGRIYFQYEEDETANEVWTVTGGSIEEKIEHFNFKGYGNGL